jgi:hypothetical protein
MSMSRSRSRSAPGAGLLLFVGVFFGVGALLFDFVILQQLYRGLDADWRYQAIRAVITESEVQADSSGSGSGQSYRPRVRYRYEVQGESITGETVSYVEWGSGDYGAAQALVEQYPVGREVDAFVDPEDPTQSVLVPGIHRFPFLVILFLLPFHCISFLMLRLRWHGRRSADTRTLIANLIQEEDGGRFVLRPIAWPWSLWFAVLLGASSFVAIFVMAFSLSFLAPAGIVFGVLGFLVLCAAALASWRRRLARAPARGCVLDDREQRLFTSSAVHPQGAASLRYEEIREIVCISKHVGESMGRSILSHLLRVDSKRGEELDLICFRGEADAGPRLAAWINEKLGIQAASATGC